MSVPRAPSSPASPCIRLRGVRVHNLRGIDLDLPLRAITVVTGVSGSGKSSLVFDTLFAEGQRRYIESFSAWSRQFLSRLEKPDADEITGIPPAIALRQEAVRAGPRETLSTATEVHDALAQLFARLGRIVCPDCGIDVARDTPESVAVRLRSLPDGTRFQIGFPIDVSAGERAATVEALRHSGFVRAIVAGNTVSLDALADSPPSGGKRSARKPAAARDEWWVVVDRLVAGKSDDARLTESLESAFREGGGRAVAVIDGLSDDLAAAAGQSTNQGSRERGPESRAGCHTIDGRPATLLRASDRLDCSSCGRTFPDPEPRLFRYHSPLGACPECHGLAVVLKHDPERLLANRRLTVRESFSIAASSRAAQPLVESLLGEIAAAEISLDLPLETLPLSGRQTLLDGNDQGFPGLRRRWEELEREAQKPAVRALLRRSRIAVGCPACGGARLRPEALSMRLDGLPGRPSLAELSARTVSEAARLIEQLDRALGDTPRRSVAPVLIQLRRRLGLLERLGLEHLPLNRAMRDLASGESRRAQLASTLAAPLVSSLYLLDEPTAGLHARDVDRVLPIIAALRDAGNTVIVVEHHEGLLRTADRVVEIGPGGGAAGGRVTFEGTAAELAASDDTATGPWLAGRCATPARTAVRRPGELGWIQLTGCRRHNLQDVSVRFPLGVLCVVTGISGAGKTSLVAGELFPAVRRLLGDAIPAQHSAEVVWIDDVPRLPSAVIAPPGDVILVDQTPLPRSLRSTPATCLKAFDVIRGVFAKTADAQVKNYGPAHFSFNAPQGRCPACEGTGQLQLEMQFLADVAMTCPECRGTRFQREILAVRHRGLTIDEVLRLTVREAAAFFARHSRVVRLLQPLRDVGLDYVPLGQSVSTLSGGERQRLRLAMHLGRKRRRASPASAGSVVARGLLYLLDEPTVGLHRSDVATLRDCFDRLIAVGHSVVVVDNNPDLVAAADWLIELGPEGGAGGGHVLRCGPAGLP